MHPSLPADGREIILRIPNCHGETSAIAALVSAPNIQSPFSRNGTAKNIQDATSGVLPSVSVTAFARSMKKQIGVLCLQVGRSPPPLFRQPGPALEREMGIGGVS